MQATGDRVAAQPQPLAGVQAGEPGWYMMSHGRMGLYEVRERCKLCPVAQSVSDAHSSSAAAAGASTSSTLKTMHWPLGRSAATLGRRCLTVYTLGIVSCIKLTALRSHVCWYTVPVQRAADNSWIVSSTSEYDEEILLDWMQHAAQQTQVLHNLFN
jgi:hypothetical protein